MKIRTPSFLNMIKVFLAQTRTGSKRAKRKALLCALPILVNSCTEAPTGSASKQGGSAKDSEAIKKVAAKTLARPQVDMSHIDGLEFRLNGFGVGLGDAFATKLPLVTFIKPDLADYVQIIRCRGDTRLSGLEDVDLGNPSSDYATMIYKTTNFWSLAGKNPFCMTITDSFGGINFVDVFAKGGDYVYLGRACANKERITSETQESVGECSRQVGISTMLRGFKNLKFEKAQAQAKRFREVRDEGDTLARQIYFLTVKLSKALEACEKRETDRKAQLIREQALTQILGIGMQIGISMFGGSDGASNFGSDAGSTFSEGLANNAGNLTQGAIRTLFVSADDYPKSCTLAQQYKDEGEIAALKLETLRAQYQDILKDITVVNTDTNIPAGNKNPNQTESQNQNQNSINDQ